MTELVRRGGPSPVPRPRSSRSAAPPTAARLAVSRATRIVALVVALAALVVAGPAPAGAVDAGDVEAARARVADAQQRADDATARYETALSRSAEIETRLHGLQQRLVDGEARARQLTAIATRFAVRAYTGGRPEVGDLFGSGDVMDAGRRTLLLERASDEEQAAIDELGALTEDLRREQSEVDAGLARQRELVTSLADEQATIDRELRAAQAAQQDLETRFRAEEAARRRAEAAAARAAASSPAAVPAGAAIDPVPTGSGGDTGGGSGGSSGIVCPIRGPVSFVDSWGAPRSGGRHHEGVDLMSPSGTPNVAVVSGTVSMHRGGLSGNGVYLHGDNGNTYWYFHLSGYSGGPRHVAQGEVVGYTGNTGNASGGPTHTHFEYHPGGGGAVNPYPLVRPVC